MTIPTASGAFVRPSDLSEHVLADLDYYADDVERDRDDDAPATAEALAAAAADDARREAEMAAWLAEGYGF